ALAGPAASAVAQLDGGPLLVDDTTAANPSLVATQLRAPAGVGQGSHSVALPPGFGIEVLAAGLTAPRFMAIDEAGNLLVADERANNVYRYPADAGVLRGQGTAPQPLLSGLNHPSSLALQDGYLYVAETIQGSLYRYAPNGA